MMKRTSRLPLVIAAIGFFLFATAVHRINDPLSKAVEILQSYVNQFTPEKVYIMTDRPFYAAGEILWYKAWLVNGVNHKTDSPSRTLYAELLSPAGEVVLSKVLKSVDGGVAGDFYLPEHLSPGVYTLRAYTNWMNNFDPDWKFRREIRIVRPGDAASQADIQISDVSGTKRMDFSWVLLDPSGNPVTNTDVDLAVQAGRERLERTRVKTDDRGLITWSTTITTFSDPDVLPFVDVAYRLGRDRIEYSLPVPQLAPMEIHFMPEGGDLIAGVDQRVAFKAVDGSGKGVSVSGVVKDSDGNEIASLADTFRGMGTFRITAEAGKTYSAEVSLNGAPNRIVQLPLAKEFGIHLTAHVLDPDDILLAIRTVGLATDVTLIGHTRGELIFSGGAQASPDGFIARVPKRNLRPGITHFTVFDGAGKPMAERLVFMAPEPYGLLEVNLDKDVYARREAVGLDIDYLFDGGNPTRANFAVSVTKADEADYEAAGGNDIRSYLLLSSDLKGYIESPSFYMNTDIDTKTLADLLMMTHGWRRFNWDDFLSGNTPQITEFVDEGVSISGTYIQRNNGRTIRNEELTIAIDPSNPSYFTVTTDNNGKFRVDGLDIADSTSVVVQGDDNNGRRPIDFTVDDLYTPTNESGWYPALSTLALGNIDANYARDARNRLAIDRSFGLSNSVRELGEIVVEAQAVTQEEVVQESYNRPYGAPDRSFVPSTSDLNRGGTAFDLIRGRTGAFRISGSGSGTRVTAARAATLTSTTSPLFFLDGVEVDAGTIARVRMQDIGVVDILTEVSSTVMFGARGSNGVISVFTRKGGPAPIPETNMVTKKVPGYYAVREFYAPNYAKNMDIHRKPDSRSTLWWAHTVRTDSNGSAKLQFYTSDDTGIYRIRVEGIDADGLPLFLEKTFRVQ